VFHKTTPELAELQDQDKDRFFLVSDRSCPKTDSLRPHHWYVLYRVLFSSYVIVGVAVVAKQRSCNANLTLQNFST